MEKLKGKVAFITGGSRGIGAGIAKRLSAEGADVVFTHSGKNSQKAVEVLAAIKATGVNGDSIVADNEDPNAIIEAMQATIEKFGSIDILVNNAGVGILKPLEEYSLSDFDELINVHIKAVFITSQYASRHMKSGGKIITIGSNMAERVPFTGGSLYSMSKSALIGLTKGIARDLGSKNISVNLVQPGPVDTDMNPGNGEGASYQRTLTALNRFGTVEEIAGLVAYLSCDESQYITGAAITIDGGTNI